MRLAILTIGQAPRDDLAADLKPLLDPRYEVVEKGILDGLSRAAIDAQFAPSPGDTLLVSRMSNGTQVSLGTSAVKAALQVLIQDVEASVDIILLLCTGKFEGLRSRRLLIEPKELVLALTKALAIDKIGILVPDGAQKEAISNWWRERGVDVEVQACSPYSEVSAFETVSFDTPSLAYVVMDCMGYTGAMKQQLSHKLGKTILLPRTIAVRMLNELVY